MKLTERGILDEEGVMLDSFDRGQCRRQLLKMQYTTLVMTEQCMRSVVALFTGRENWDIQSLDRETIVSMMRCGCTSGLTEESTPHAAQISQSKEK